MTNQNRKSDFGSNQSGGRGNEDLSLAERNVMTIKEAVRRAKSEGLPVSEYSLRKWVKNGEISVRWIGTKALVYYPSLAAYLCFHPNAPKVPFNESNESISLSLLKKSADFPNREARRLTPLLDVIVEFALLLQKPASHTVVGSGANQFSFIDGHVGTDGTVINRASKERDGDSGEVR